MDKQTGFTLVELVSVIVLISILAVVAIPATTSSDAQRLQAARDDLRAALQHAQHIAMSRSDAGNPVTFSYSANSISVNESGSALVFGQQQYPLNFSNNIQLSASQSSPLSFDKLGKTTATTFTLSLNSTSATLSLSGAGYAY